MTESENKPSAQEKTQGLTEEQKAQLLKTMPQEIAGTPEWKLKVQVRATDNLLEEIGFENH